MTPDVALGLREGIRLTRHPLVLTGAAVAVGLSVESLRLRNPLYVYQGITLIHSFYLGPMIIVAAFRTVRRDRRAGTGEVVAAAPIGPRRRVAALLWAVSGPALLTAVLVLTTYFCYRYGGAMPLRWPGIAELAVQPVRLLGAGLLGVLAALWLPGRTAPVLALCGVGAAMAAVNAFVHGHFRLVVLALFPFGDLAGLWFSPGWHVAYLGSLDALAACGALLATPGPRRWPLAGLTVAALSAMVTGWLQLP